MIGLYEVLRTIYLYSSALRIAFQIGKKAKLYTIAFATMKFVNTEVCVKSPGTAKTFRSTHKTGAAFRK